MVRPVAGTLSVVCDGEHAQDEVDDLLWKAGIGTRLIPAAATVAKAGPALLVPLDGMFDIDRRFRLELDCETHSAASSARS